MSGKIFLTSCGLKEKEESDALFNYLKTGLLNKKALIITNATTTGHNERAITPTKERLLSGGAKEADIVVLDENNYNIISSYDIVYVVGGDLFPLIYIANKVNLRSVIVSFLNNGGVYIGESAGSLIMCKNAKWYYDVNRPFKNVSDDRKEPNTYDCLDLVSENIYPHFDKKSNEVKEAVKNYMQSTNIKINPLEDGKWVEINFKN